MSHFKDLGVNDIYVSMQVHKPILSNRKSFTGGRSRNGKVQIAVDPNFFYKSCNNPSNNTAFLSP